ncbi:MAG: DUF3068 domain-containing protein [Actinomycetota bacterium]|nr:DUF3068 domain-containing protein [Actinomycetota bacterium]
MRRIGGFVLVMLGLLFIFLAPFLRFYATPRVEKAPLDLYDRIVSDGQGQYFSTSPKFLRLVGPVPFENTQVFRGDPEAGSSTTAVYDSFSSTKDTLHNAIIDASKARIVFDRVTGLAVHCCGENPRAEGLTLKFPFDVHRTTYQLWDGTAKQALPATYLRDGHIVGLGVYLFLIQAGPMVIDHVDVPGSFVGVPDQKTVTADMTYQVRQVDWVEPETGAILKGIQHAVRWLAYQGKPVLKVAETTLTPDQQSVNHIAHRLKSQLSQLHLEKTVIPIFGPILGLVLIVAGALLLRGPRKRRTAVQPKPVKDREETPAQ